MLLTGGKTQSKPNESDEQKSKTSLSSNFVKYGLKRVCCHCSRSENETYEVKYSITRRTDGKTVHRKKLPLVMSELPKVLCLEIRNSYSFICNLCIEKNIKLVEKFGKVNVTSKVSLKVYTMHKKYVILDVKIFLLYSI